VCIGVLVQGRQPPKGLCANLTLILGFTRVHSYMSRQGICPRKGSAAILTNVWLFSTVRPKMQLQICTFSECSAANVADVRLYACVGTHVSYQRSTLSKAFTTDFTQVALLHIADAFMSFFVIGQRLRLSKGFWAQRAFVGSIAFILKTKYYFTNCPY
jgi:hypothetical protein